MSETVLVTGATGNQGGAVIDHLLDRDEAFDVRGLTRDASSERAGDLRARGVTMVEGDLGEPETLREPVGEADQVFAVTNFWTQGYDGQVRQGKHLVDVAVEEGVSLQMVDTRDVGRVAAEVIANPGEYVGERFDLAGDELTLAQTAHIISEVSGIDVDPHHGPIEDAYEEFGEEFTVMCEWFNEVGYSASVDGLPHRFGFEFVDLEGYLRDHGWEDKEEPAATPGWLKAFA